MTRRGGESSDAADHALSTALDGALLAWYRRILVDAGLETDIDVNVEQCLRDGIAGRLDIGDCLARLARHAMSWQRTGRIQAIPGDQASVRARVAAYGRMAEVVIALNGAPE